MLGRLNIRRLYLGSVRSGQKIYARFFFQEIKNSVSNLFSDKKKDLRVVTNHQSTPSLTSRIAAYMAGKLLNSIMKSISAQLKETEEQFEYVLTSSVQLLNDDPQARRILGSNIEIVQIFQESSSLNEVEGKDDIHFVFEKVMFGGSRGQCVGKIMARFSNSDSSVDIRELKLFHEGRTIDIKLKHFDHKIIDM